MTEKNCYYCGRPATSREHVPPQCIFPEQKDSFGKDYRKNLITVPSCDEHNLKKCKDDEFLMANVTPTVGNNGAGYIQTKTKLRRAFDRTNLRLLNTTISNAKEALWVSPSGKKFPILVGEPDMPRLIRALDYVVRGIYFHLVGVRFIGQCHIIPDWIKFPKDPNLETSKKMFRRQIVTEKQNWLRFGDNPEIFKFYIGPTDELGFIPMLLVFFRGSYVYVSLQPDGIKTPFQTFDEAVEAFRSKLQITP